MKVEKFIKEKDWKCRKVKITKIIEKEDKILEGKIGMTTVPFVVFEGKLGIYLDDKTTMRNGMCNLLDEDEIKIIK